MVSIKNIEFNIYDSEVSYHGGNQYWFPKKFNQLSGCGPVAAANITAYLAQNFPDKYNALYPYDGIITKKDFIEHMVAVRKYVKPGFFGLTSVNQFSDNILAFSRNRGVILAPHILEENPNSMQDAVDFITEGLSLKLPIAILILKHPVEAFKEYTWHWMTITGLRLNLEDNLYYILVSTYGELKEINFNRLWNERRPKDIIRLAFFS